MAIAASEKPSIHRSTRLRSGQSTKTFHDNKIPLQRVKPTRQPQSESSVQKLYHLTESLVARIEVLERHDEGHARPECLHSDSSDNSTYVAVENGNRQLYKMLEAALARVLVLEGRRDICYQNAFKAASETECIVRGCGSKPTSCKNDVRHLKNTRSPEHEVAAILLQQTECLQCGENWKSWVGLDHHERTVHQETRSSRMDTFRPYLEQPLSSLPGCQSTQPSPPGPDGFQATVSDLNQISWSSSNDFRPLADLTPADVPLDPRQPGAGSLPPHEWDPLRPKWSSSNDFQPFGNAPSAYPSMQPLQQGLDGPFSTTAAPKQSVWSRSDYHQQLTAAAPGDPSTQSTSSEFVLPQPSWSDSNDFYHPEHY